tara:strand:- start:2008 stop:2181 length:174 start_codon:yes stop_codon:yes gene_type:complete
LKGLHISGNNLTNPDPLTKLKLLKALNLGYNPDLTKTKIDELKKSLPKCKIHSNPKK